MVADRRVCGRRRLQRRANARRRRAGRSRRAASSAAAAATERIVYSSLRPGNWDIFYFADAPAPRRGASRIIRGSTTTPRSRPTAAGSCSRRSAAAIPDLYALEIEGGGEPRLLIDSPAMEDQVAFAPDGRSIAFVSTASGNADIYVLPFMPETTAGRSRPPPTSRIDPGGDFRPDFSPDGARIAFTTDRDTASGRSPDLRASRASAKATSTSMDRDGGNVQRLTATPDWDGSPEWSADGRTLYFYSARPREIVGPPTSPILGQEGGFRIWAMNADGSNPRAVTPEGVEALAPAVTADGRVAYQKRTGYARWSIESVADDGSGARAESDTATDYWLPDFHAASGAMVVHGVGPAVGETQAVEEILGAGALLAADYPADVAIPDRTVTLYPMRHTTGLAPHPDRNETAVTIENEAGTRLVLADFDGANQRELFAVPNVGIVSGTPNRVFDIKWSDDGEWITYTQGFFFGQGTDEADVWVMRADGSERRNLSEGNRRQRGRRRVLAGREQARVPQRAQRPIRSVLDQPRRHGAEGAHERRGARELSRCSRRAATPIAFSSNRDGARDGSRQSDVRQLPPRARARRHARASCSESPIIRARTRTRGSRRTASGSCTRPSAAASATRSRWCRRSCSARRCTASCSRGGSATGSRSGSRTTSGRRAIRFGCGQQRCRRRETLACTGRRVAGGARAARLGTGAARPVSHACHVHETARGRAYEHAYHDRRAAR